MTVSVVIGDVGHGNCAILREDDYVALVDVAPGGIPEALLRDAQVTRIDDIVISHADDDHVGGLPSVLRQFDVGSVWINADGARIGPSWQAVRVAVRDAEQQGRVIVRGGLGSGVELGRPNGRMQIKVVSPTGSDLLWQTGSSPPGVRVFTANAMSAVVMVVVDTRTEVLLAADAGDSTFRRMLAAGVDLRAPVLVFPHHGGRPGSGDPSTFAADVCSAVAPEVVIFSVGRARDGFPRQEVVSAVRATVPNAHVACTQLTTHCASKVPPADPAHIHVLSAAGRLKRSCCAGTVEFSYPVGAGSQMLPTVAEHRQFVLTEATTRMCN